MKSGRYRWVLTLFRYGLCLAAIAFLVTAVRWHDYVKLNDADKTPVRLIDRQGDELVVLRDGQEVRLTAADVHHLEVAGQRVLDIEYGIPGVVRQTDRSRAFWSVLMFLPVPLLAAWRLTWMLKVQQVYLSLWNSVKLTFAGNFFNFALPGMTGGDLIKAYYVTRFTKKKTEAVTTVFLDRVVGLSSLVLMAGAMIIFTRDPSQFQELAVWLAVILAGLAVAAIVVYSRRLRRLLRLRDIVERLPMSQQIQRIADATLAMRRHKLIVLLALVITFALQSICIVSATVMAWALKMEGEFHFYFIYIAIGFVIAALPIWPPQSIGVMEFFYVLFFAIGGNNTESQAFALAIAVRLIQLVWSLPGVLVPLLGAHLPKRAELQALEALEESAAGQPVGADDKQGDGGEVPGTARAK